MYKNKTFLAVILARGGSKRLPGKNVLTLNGKPLIVWSIIAALRSKYIDKVVVSSDDDEILNIAKGYGVNIIKRPAQLANDKASSFDAIKHTIKNCEKYDFTILLQPTSPLRNENHIDESIELLELKKSDAIISVSEAEHSPLWCNKLPYDNSMENFLSNEILNKRSQDLDKFYRLNGAIYICKTKKLLEEKTFFLKKNIFAYIMPKLNSIDIDDELDFKMAEALFDKT